MSRRKKKMESSPTVEAIIDRISQLPDEIIYIILQSLPYHKQAARTSVLSKRWLQLWRSYPVVDDYGYEFKNFEGFAVATSKRLLHDRTVPLLLDSLNISRLFRDERQSDFYQLLLSTYLSSVEDDNRSPHKVVVKNGFHSSSLEGGGMLLNCRRTKFLHLQGLNLSGFRSYKACRYNLQELTLDYVRVSAETFPSCLANAPLLEKLSLTSIYGIRCLDISASNFLSLKSLFFDGKWMVPNNAQDELHQLQLSSAPLLQTLIFLGRNCKFLNVVSAPNVKFVELQSMVGELGRREFDDLISKLPSLESLDFNIRCIGADVALRISAPMLRKLTLTQTKTQNKFEIDAPNLVTLSIRTDYLPININIVNVASSCQCVVQCCPINDKATVSWFIELRKCLAALTTRFHHLVFELFFYDSQMNFLELSELDLSQVGCRSSALVVQHLQLGTDLRLGPINRKKHAGKNRLLDGILSTLHPKTLSIARLSRSRDNRSLFSYISGEIKMKNLQDCCSSGKCWRHRFKDAKITSFSVHHFATMHRSMISQPSVHMMISFP